MTEQTGDYLIEQMNSPGGKPSDYSDEVFGKVQSTNPLTIWVSQSIQLSGSFLELTTEAKGLTINVSLPVGTNKEDVNGTASGNIVIFPPLQVGDRVRMLRVQKGQRFIVLGRA
ncbi:DUF2577 family protein [Fructilactobacillus vespulae]|uniref:DUF2577 family protein n=1 Tax=Fructilactobacillus vespulae TaxID=1249630 RepID=UPI0039B6BE8A